MRLAVSLLLLTLPAAAQYRSTSAALQAFSRVLGGETTQQAFLLSVYDQGGRLPLDISARPATATFTGAGTTWSTSPIGPALKLSGADSNYVDWGNPQKLQDVVHFAGSFTICSAFTIDGGDGADRNLLRKHNAVVLWLWRISTGNVIQFQYGDSTGTLGSVSGATTLLANSRRIRTACVVQDSIADTLTVYVDGRQDASVNDTASSFTNVPAGNVRSCSQAGSNNECWNGKKIVDMILSKNISAGAVAEFHRIVMHGIEQPFPFPHIPSVPPSFFGSLNNPIVQ